MTDQLRAEITNAIWLCRNCHKLIDGDEIRFHEEILFRWREEHEKYVLSELGNKSNVIESEILQNQLNPFKGYPSIIRRIIIDRPTAWEYHLTSELMKHLNKKGFRKLRDLKEDLYVKSQIRMSETQAFDWIQEMLTEALNLIPPFEKLFKYLTKSWGEPGKPGDVEEIHHICLLIQDLIDRIIEYEEKLCFTNVPEEFDELKSLLRARIGSQALRIETVPEKLDRIVQLVIDRESNNENEPLEITETITFDLPEEWSDKFSDEMKNVVAIIKRDPNRFGY